MPQLNPISPRKLIKIVNTLGFQLLRTKGSHHFYRDEKGNTTVIPIHGNEDISTGLLKKILRDIQLSTDEFENLRK